MHLSLSDELHSFNIEDKEKSSFEPIFEESEQLNLEISTIFRSQTILKPKLSMSPIMEIMICYW
jgi:hypothetical protein